MDKPGKKFTGWEEKFIRSSCDCHFQLHISVFCARMIKTLAKGVNYLLGSVLQKKRVFIGSSLDYLHRERRLDKNYFDYVRLSALELISFRIKNKQLVGNVAELGVYKGKFARYINQYFSDRTLYLFDTFRRVQ